MASWVSERTYTLLTEEDEGRACEAIPEEACAEAPRNFTLNAGNGAATKLAEQVASPGVVLALLLATVGAPVALIGLLEPVRRGFALVPQLAVSAYVRAARVRKWLWVGAGLVQAATLVAMAVAAATAGGVVAGAVVVGALAVFSLASGLGSLAFQDVVGKTIPRPKRGRLLAARATAGGAFTLAVGLVLRGVLGAETSRTAFAALLLGAAGLWVLAAALFASTTEPSGATGGGRNALAEARQGVRTVMRVAVLRRYVIARTLLVSVELALPFYALYARDSVEGAGALGLYIAAIGVAALVANPLWGRLSDRRSNRLVLVLAAGVGAAGTGLALVLGAVGAVAPALFALVFLVASSAEAGVRLARKAWVVNAAPDGERALWTSTSNVLAGLVTLALAVLGVIAQATTVRTVLWVLLAMAAAGGAAALALPDDTESG